MSQLMGQHAFQFFFVQHAQDALGYSHGGMMRIASGGKSVGRIRRYQVNPGHWQPDMLRKPLNNPIYLRELFTRSWLSAVCHQGNLVRPEVSDKVHDSRKYKGVNHAILAAKTSADGDDDQRQQ